MVALAMTVAQLALTQCSPGTATGGLVYSTAGCMVLSGTPATVGHTHSGADITSPPATATALASNPTDCAGGQYATAIDASGNLTCSTPAAGSWPTGKLTSPVAVAVSASYVTVFSVTPGTSKENLLSFHMLHTASATTVGVQFRVLSADSGNVGNCFFQTKGVAGTAASATAEEYDTIAIGSNPSDTAAAAASATALNLVDINCQFVSDGSPGAVVLEAQLETGTTSINILAGSYYNLVTN